MLPRVYEVAKLGDEREEKLRRKPLGVGKSRRAVSASAAPLMQDNLYRVLGQHD